MINDLSFAPSERDFDFAESFGGSLFGGSPCGSSPCSSSAFVWGRSGGRLGRVVCSSVA